MHGGPKAILVLKREEGMMPDFSGPGYIKAKKKMVHSCPHPDHEDEAYASKPMTTDDTYEEPDEGDTDPPMDDMDIDAKLKQMKDMAAEMMQISKELEKASKMHKGQADKLRVMAKDHDEAMDESDYGKGGGSYDDAIGGASLKEESESSYRSKKFPLSGSREQTKELKKAERERKRTKRDIEKRDRKIYRRMKKAGELE